MGLIDGVLDLSDTEVSNEARATQGELGELADSGSG